MTTRQISKTEAEEAFRAFLDRAGGDPEGFKYGFESMGGFSQKFGRGLWADEASVDVRAFYSGYDSKVERTITFRVEVSWSSTHRTPAQALAALVSYREATEFAAMCEAFLSELPQVVVPAKVDEEVEIGGEKAY